jgi:hypothetical protein
VVDSALPLAPGGAAMQRGEVSRESGSRADDQMADMAVEEAVASIGMVLDWTCGCGGKRGRHCRLL